MNEDNLIYLFGNLSYDKDLQKQIFNREDTALQRRMADAAQAGLNPNLVVGQGASAGQAISTSAPSNDTKSGQGNPNGALDAVAALVSGYGSILNAQMTKAQYDEYVRNTNWYKDRNLPSDVSAKGAEIPYLIAMGKGLPDNPDTKGIIDKAKQYVTDLFGGSPDADSDDDGGSILDFFNSKITKQQKDGIDWRSLAKKMKQYDSNVKRRNKKDRRSLGQFWYDTHTFLYGTKADRQRMYEARRKRHGF